METTNKAMIPGDHQHRHSASIHNSQCVSHPVEEMLAWLIESCRAINPKVASMAPIQSTRLSAVIGPSFGTVK